MDKTLYRKARNSKRHRLLIFIIFEMIVCFSLGLFVGKLSVKIGATVIAEYDTVIAQPINEPVVEPINKEVSLGVCKLTAYCIENYPHICNDGDSTRTATGTKPTPGRTVAVDPNVIPYGSEVIINGHTYIAEDCGGAIKGNRVDIVFATHREALNFGIQYAEVSYVIKEVA